MAANRKTFGLCVAVAALAATSLTPLSASAAQRALLIGIDEYQHVTGLEGPVNDARRIGQFLMEHMGFRAEEIVTVTNGDATYQGLRDAFQRELVQATSPGDRVIIYYSGHGGQVPDRNGDEEDGLDETLVPVDGYADREDNHYHFTDDEFGEVMALIADRDVTVFIDACHSGTITRGEFDAPPASGPRPRTPIAVGSRPATEAIMAHRQEESFVTPETGMTDLPPDRGYVGPPHAEEDMPESTPPDPAAPGEAATEPGQPQTGEVATLEPDEPADQGQGAPPQPGPGDQNGQQPAPGQDGGHEPQQAEPPQAGLPGGPIPTPQPAPGQEAEQGGGGGTAPVPTPQPSPEQAEQGTQPGTDGQGGALPSPQPQPPGQQAEQGAGQQQPPTQGQNQQAQGQQPPPGGSQAPGEVSHRIWSAAAAFQYAWEDGGEGLFTTFLIQGAGDRLADANGNGIVSNAELIDYVRESAEAWCRDTQECADLSLGFTPTLEASSADMAAAFVPLDQPVEDPTDVIVHENPAGVAIEVLPSNHNRVGDRVAFRVTSKRPGWLILLDINAAGEIVQLIPNDLMTVTGDSHEIVAGEPVLFPAQGSRLVLHASPPLGEGLLIAIVAEDDVPLNELVRVSGDFSPQRDPQRYLAELAKTLAAVWSDGEQNRALNWSMATLPYTISE